LELKAPLGHACHKEHVKAQVREAFVTFWFVLIMKLITFG